jgi:hypothetical protein
MGKFKKAAFASESTRAPSRAYGQHFQSDSRGRRRVIRGCVQGSKVAALKQKSNSLIKLLLHQDQRKHLPKLTSHIFNAFAGDEAVSLVDVFKAKRLLLCNKNPNL